MLTQIRRTVRWSRGHALYIVLALAVTTVSFVSLFQQAEAVRFVNRSMYINSARGGDTTHYIVSLAYPTASPLGSLRMEFCDNPIPSLPCDIPPGLDVSSGTLTDQSGTTVGFSVSTQTQNLIILSRAPQLPGAGNSSYRFDNMVNPTGETQDFYIRMTSHASMDGTGPIIDYGSVSATTTQEVGLYTQVPPVLIFCVAAQINDNNCEDLDGNYVDFGTLSPDQTVYASSEIQARTNAQYGYSISVHGKTMTSGIKEIPSLTVPTQSFPGVGQFGMNLAVNTTPAVGATPTGPGTNAVVNPVYETPDFFLFIPGDVIVTSSAVTMTRKFTANYIVNVPEDQPAGVYSTTVTYVCLAGF